MQREVFFESFIGQLTVLLGTLLYISLVDHCGRSLKTQKSISCHSFWVEERLRDWICRAQYLLYHYFFIEKSNLFLRLKFTFQSPSDQQEIEGLRVSLTVVNHLTCLAFTKERKTDFGLWWFCWVSRNECRETERERGNEKKVVWRVFETFSSVWKFLSFGKKNHITSVFIAESLM